MDKGLLENDYLYTYKVKKEYVPDKHILEGMVEKVVEISLDIDEYDGHIGTFILKDFDDVGVLLVDVKKYPDEIIEPGYYRWCKVKFIRLSDSYADENKGEDVQS